MKNIFYILLLLPTIIFAQYPSNSGQKITLGEQTTADGLVFRGRASIDTVTATSKITRVNKQDTSAFLLLDTVTNLLWHYKTASNGWIQAGGSTLDTATMLLPYWRSGRFSGTLPVANGGTNASTFTAGSIVFAGTSGTYTQDNSGLFYDNTNDRLGIGTASPSNKLNIVGQHAQSISLESYSSTYSDYQGEPTLSLNKSASNTIGTKTNTRDNENLGSVPFQGVVNSAFRTAAYLRVTQTGVVGAENIPAKFGFYTSDGTNSATERMTIASNGNVGIGTASPGYRLEVVGTDGTAGATSTVLRLLGNIGGVNKSGGLFFRTLNSTTTGTERIAIIQSADVDNNTRILALNPTGGNVGIGTTSPGTLLDVKGVGTNLTGNIYYNFFARNAAGSQGIYLGYNETATVGVIGGGGQSTNGIAFTTGPSFLERMRIDGSGNVGIGVTPSAWSDFKVLEFANGVYVGTYTGGGQTMYLGANNYFNGTDYIYKVSAYATRYQQASGAHQWFVSTISGTAGNVASFTQAMTLGSNNGLSIGTTTAAPANGLLVAGAATFSNTLTVNSIGGSINLIQSSLGAATYYVMQNTIETGGKKYRFGYTGGSLDKGSFSIYNETDNILPFLIASTGAATFSSSVEARKLYVSPSGGAGSGSDGIVNIQTVSSTLGQTSELGLIIKNNGTNGYYSQIGFGYAESKVGAVIAGLITNGGGASSSALVFGTRSTTTGSDAPTERMRITSDGNVGIGTVSPNLFSASANKLVVGTTSGNNGITIAGGTTGFTSIYFADGTTGNEAYRGYLEYGHSSDYLSFGTAASERMRIASGGNVGIGTVSPQVKLSVQGTQNNTIIPANAVAKFVGGDAGIFVGNLAGTPNYGAWLQAMRESDAFVFPLSLQPNGGNVGIGTTSPNFKTHISTGSNTSITQPTAGTYGLYIQQNTSGNVGGLYIQDGASNSGNSIYVGDNNGAARFVVNTDGNVGIGTASPGYKLHVEGTSATLTIADATSYTQGVGGKLTLSGNYRAVGDITEAGYIKASKVNSTSNDYGFDMIFATSNNPNGLAERMRISSTGVVTITALGNGTVTAASGVLSATSDMNLKIEDGFIDNALDKIMNLKPRYFYWKEETGLPTNIRQLGFYAQEVNQSLGEEAANTPKNENDKWGIYDRSIIAMLTKAVQELSAEIDILKQEIINLKNK